MNEFIQSTRLQVRDVEHIIDANKRSTKEIMIAKSSDENHIYKKLTMRKVRRRILYTVYNIQGTPVMSQSSLLQALIRYNVLPAFNKVK